MLLEEKYVKFIIKNNLTQPQFLLLHLMYKKRLDLIKEYRVRFPSDNGSMVGKRLTDDLINRGFIVKNEKGYVLGDDFLDIYIDDYNAGNEIYEIYPKFLQDSRGINIPLTTMDKNLFRKIYIDKILYNRQEHLEVIKDIEYGKLKGLLNLGLDKFVNSEFWLSIREQRLQDEEEDVIENASNYDDF